MDNMLRIDNDGPLIVSTNYWQTDAALRGLCYLTGNAGDWRLLVPASSSNGMLPEMRTGKRVLIEHSIHLPGRAYDVVFDDGTKSPYSIAIEPAQIDRLLVPHEGSRLMVYTSDGLQLTLPCVVRSSQAPPRPL